MKARARLRKTGRSVRLAPDWVPVASSAPPLQIPPMSNGEREYVLGTNDAELVRLGYQHRVWAGPTADAWERAGIHPGAHVLDVGCGPGYGTFDLAQLVGESGRVYAVDVSARFVGHLAEEARRRGIGHIEARVEDLETLSVPASSVDFAFARWVLCFLRNPERAVERVARALRPGGAFVVMDYSNYEAFRIAPRSAAMERVIGAVAASFRTHGGNPDVGLDVPGYMVRAGLQVRSIRPIVRLARPGSALWDWPWTFFVNFLPVLVESGGISESDRDAFVRDWQERSVDPGAFLMTPPMTEIIGVAPR